MMNTIWSPQMVTSDQLRKSSVVLRDLTDEQYKTMCESSFSARGKGPRFVMLEGPLRIRATYGR